MYMSDDENGREIMLATKADPSRFAEVFDRHYPVIYRYLRRRIPAGIAEELAAETFLIAFEQRDRFDAERGSLRAWLFGITANLMRHERRREVRELKACRRTGRDRLSDEFEGVDRRLDAERATPALAAGLAELSSGDREVLLLFTWADLSYEEIATALDIPVGTVRSRLSRSRRRLRERLGTERQLTAETILTEGGSDE